MAAWKKAALLVIIAAAVVVAVGLWGMDGMDDMDGMDASREAEIPAEIIAERGPRPDVSRLPPGVRRVEAEIAAAPAEGPQRERQLKKKELIEASIERLGR